MRLRVVIALGAVGLLLVVAVRTCGDPAPNTATDRAPAVLTDTHRARHEPTPDPELPVPRDSLREAAEIVRSFLTLYSFRDPHDDARERNAQLADLTTQSPSGLLATDPPSPTTHQNDQSTTGTVSALKIRLLAPTTIQFLATVNQTITSRNAARRASSTYAITLLQDDTWRVDSLERADAGDSGGSQP